MRVDKFLKVSRLIKRRTVAASAASANRVIVNGRAVKPAYSLKTGDEIEVVFGNATLKARVKSLDEKAAIKAPESLYEVIE